MDVLNVNNIVDGASENAKMIFEVGIGELPMELLIASIVVGVLIGFFGLKLVKVMTAITGFFVGAGIGIVVSGIMELTGMTVPIVVFACAVVLALLAFFLYRAGVFLLVLEMVFGIAVGFIDTSSMVQFLIALAAAVLAAVLAVIYIEPVVIIITAIAGGIGAGTAAAQIVGVESNSLIAYGICIVLAIIGMVVQFMMHSRKVGKKEKIYSAKVKKDVSVESEVEKARMILDDEDEEDNAGDEIEIIDDFDDEDEK